MRATNLAATDGWRNYLITSSADDIDINCVEAEHFICIIIILSVSHYFLLCLSFRGN
jgi:hypothetical protein